MKISDFDSPFQVGVLVYPENFKGRVDVLDDIIYPLSTISNNTQKHFFITGDKNIGKTSLTKYIAEYVESEYKFLSVYVDNKGIKTVEELLKKIITSLLKRAKKESISLRFTKLIKETMTQGDTWSINVKIDDKSPLFEDIKNTFIYTIQELFKDIHDKRALLIIIDDINGLSDNEIFPNWYKSMVDTIAVDNDIDIPIVFILTGYSKKYAKLHRLNPSFSRIFKREQLNLLTNEEVSSFYRESFNKINVDIDEDALTLMVDSTKGLPLLMQEIGNSIFNKLRINHNITKEVATQGIIAAGETIGQNHVITSYEEYDNYKECLSILYKISQFDSFSFTRKELERILNIKEKEFLDEFLNININANIFELKDDKYYIKNDLFKIYFDTLNLRQTLPS